MKHSGRFEHLDSLRGIAALIVVICHYIAAFMPYAIFANNRGSIQHVALEEAFHYPPFGLIIAGHLSVCLFFILSGFVLSYSTLSGKASRLRIIGNMIKRPVRLGGVVYFSIIVSCFLWWANLYSNTDASTLSSSTGWLGRYWSEQPHILRVLKDLLFSPFTRGPIYDGPLWTIKIELYGSLLVYAFLLLFAYSRYRVPILVVLIAMFWNSFYVAFFFGVLSAIIMNYIVKNGVELPDHVKKYILPLMWIVGIYYASYPFYLKAVDVPSGVYFRPDILFGLKSDYTMMAAFLIFWLTLLHEPWSRILHARVLMYLGNISYSVYAVHFLVMGSISSWLYVALMNQGYGYVLSFVIVLFTGLPIVIGIADLMTKWVDNPSIRLANRLAKWTEERLYSYKGMLAQDNP